MCPQGGSRPDGRVGHLRQLAGNVRLKKANLLATPFNLSSVTLPGGRWWQVAAGAANVLIRLFPKLR